MTISFQLPQDIEDELRQYIEDLDEAAKESLLVELYRREKISRPQLSRALGIDRLATDGLLKRHQVTEDLLTVAEFDEELANLQKTPKPR